MMDYTEIQCGKCGVYFCVPAKFDREHRESRDTFWCPNGHPRAYRESEADTVRRERDRLKQQLASKDDDIRWQHERRVAAERSAAAYRGQATKLRKRAKAGVCACCNRTFQNLAAHMKTKHPGFEDEEPLKVIDGGKVA